MVGLWLRGAPRKGSNRGVELVGLGVLILILLPQISITDDLQSLRYPAEVRSAESWRHYASARLQVTPYPSLHPVPTPALQAFAALGFGFKSHGVLSTLTAHTPDSGASISFQNRPPPAA
jgi:hypothetical protein